MDIKKLRKCYDREISIQGEGALQLVQLSISFLICCFEKCDFYFLLFLQLSLKLIDNWANGSAHSPCIVISLVMNSSYIIIDNKLLAPSNGPFETYLL